MARRAASIALLAALVAPSPARAQEPPVTLRAINVGEELVLHGVPARGYLRPGELELVSTLLRCSRTGRVHPIDPSLARLLVQISRHFGRPLVIVSGYRARVPPRGRGRRRSYHLRGEAVDLYAYGVPPRLLRDYAVSLGVPGIGFYPNGGFVHLDVRERTFWWVDYSGPGERSRLIADPAGTAPEVEWPGDRSAEPRLSALRDRALRPGP